LAGCYLFLWRGSPSTVRQTSFYTITAREAKLLYQLPEGQLSGGTDERLAQDDLASWIGMLREVVARSLKELENKGAIEVHRGKIKIRNKNKTLDWD
jgi:CRP/FNR family transcriptional regulator